MATQKKEIVLSKAQKRVFDYMIENDGITSKEAFDHLGETRLSDKIFVMKKHGVHISTEWKRVKNRYKEECRVKVYRVG